MKYILFFACFVLEMSMLFAQKSEDFIPTDAVTVFSLNNISLLQKVSLDELVQYEFMAEIQQELFDGSTSGKTLKDSGIDFEQKLNVYYGKGAAYEVAGFSFGIKNLDELFTVFDDFTEIESPLENVRFFSSYFNHLLVKGNVGLLLRVDPVATKVKEVADSIWYSRGYGALPPSYYQEYYDELYDSEGMDTDYEEVNIVEEPYDVSEEVERIEEGEEKALFEEQEDLGTKNYSELRDSVFAELQTMYLNRICLDLFVNGNNLRKTDADLAELMTHDVEGVFYLDNSRNILRGKGFGSFGTMFPSLQKDFKDLYSGNKIMGDVVLNNHSIEANITANYGEALGSIYEKLNDSKFDKKVAKYIHKDNSAYFTYNVNLREAYEQAYDIILPLLRDEKSTRIATNVLAIELLNELIDKDALFDTYRGSMFGTFSGVRKVQVKKIEFTYDENFNYEEKEVESEEDMPIFTLGFSTKRNDIPAIVLKQIAKLTSECKNMGDYWIFENAIFNSVPLYILNKDDMFVLTNDENLAIHHSNGFGKNKLSKKQLKKAKKSGFVYAQIDWSKTINTLPREIFSTEQAELLDAMSGKTGVMTLTSSKTTKTNTKYDVRYDFNGSYENPGQYVLDLVNSLYIMMK